MPLQSICKQEAANRPCPRIILVCCTHLVTGGLSAEGLFQKDAPEDLVHFLLGAFEEGETFVTSCTRVVILQLTDHLIELS